MNVVRVRSLSRNSRNSLKKMQSRPDSSALFLDECLAYSAPGFFRIAPNRCRRCLDLVPEPRGKTRGQRRRFHCASPTCSHACINFNQSAFGTCG